MKSSAHIYDPSEPPRLSFTIELCSVVYNIIYEWSKIIISWLGITM